MRMKESNCRKTRCRVIWAVRVHAHLFEAVGKQLVLHRNIFERVTKQEILRGNPAIPSAKRPADVTAEISDWVFWVGR